MSSFLRQEYLSLRVLPSLLPQAQVEWIFGQTGVLELTHNWVQAPPPPAKTIPRSCDSVTCQQSLGMLNALRTPLQGSENDPNFKLHSGNEDPKGFGHIGFAVPDVESACKVRPYPTPSLMPTRCLIST